MLARHLLATAAGGLLIAAVPHSSTQAQAKPATTKATTTKPDSIQADRRLIHEATADNLLEVRLGELAERKATNPSRCRRPGPWGSTPW
jgi:predicted outer membrane protein